MYIKYSYKHESIDKLFSLYKKQKLDFNPAFQRQFIWSLEFKKALIISLLKQYPIGTLVLWMNRETGKYEVVDGQQRLKTIFYFIEGKKDQFTAISKGRHYDEYWNILKKSNIEKNKIKKVNFANLPPSFQKLIRTTTKLMVLYLNAEDQKLVSDYFTYIQNQDSLKPGELFKSSSDFVIGKAINNLAPDLKTISEERLIFKDKRGDFNKIFINIIGLKENKLKLGCKNTEVAKFFYDSLKAGGIEIETQKKINAFLAFFNKIAELEELTEKVASWRRFFKLILILFFICDYNFEPNPVVQLSKIVKFNKTLAIHDSKKPESKKAEEFAKTHPKTNYWNFEDNLDLLKITKDTQTKDTILKIMKTFIKYLEVLHKKK